MAGKHLSLGAAWGLCDDSRVMAPVTDGAEISRRRKQLIWNQATLAKRAGVGLTTVVQIEKNRNVRIDGLRAVIEALDKEERKRGLAGPNLKCSWLEPLRKSDEDWLYSLRTRLNASARSAERSTQKCKPLTKWTLEPPRPLRYGSISNTSLLGNSDNQQGARMSLLQIARDDEEIRCMPPQRIAPPSSSRVLPFPSPVVEMSHEDRMRALDQYDPESAEMIRRAAERLYKLLPNATQR
jgi:transcriptional regulator with XRE-family HTH domain